jgi:hypothetical protein
MNSRTIIKPTLKWRSHSRRYKWHGHFWLCSDAHESIRAAPAEAGPTQQHTEEPQWISA